MIYRVVLAVVLAIALLAAVQPALDDARRDRASALVADQLRALERTADRLVLTDDAGGRRVVTLHVPRRSQSSAGVEWVQITPGEGSEPAVATWRLSSGRERSRTLSATEIQTVSGDPLRLGSTGRHRLVLTHTGDPGDPAVSVRRLK